MEPEENPLKEDDKRSLEKKVYDLKNLIEMGMSLSSNLDFQSLVESVLYSCIGQIMVEGVAILLQVDIDIDDYYIHMSAGYDNDFDSREIILDEFSPLVKYLRDNPFPMEYQDLKKDANLLPELEKLHLLSPAILVPMKSKDQLNGIIILGEKIRGGGFTRDEKEFLSDLSKFAAIAVENSRLYLMATLDRMTRLYIHHYFQERLLEETKRAQRYNTPLSLIISDIDYFKNFNDSFGHQVGDMVLKETAKLFKKSLRKVDIPARYGGEEFVVILPETKLMGALTVAERLRKSVARHRFPGGGDTLAVTISIGVAQFDISRDKNKDDLIKRADLAMYKAKKMGRNRTGVYKMKNPIREY